MKTKNTIVSIVICFFFVLASCASTIGREGYKLDGFAGREKDCANIIVIKSLNYNPELVEIVGKISASDSGFSVTCSEEYVIENFKKDACAVGADLINITKESHPDFWSTCYRAKAELLRIKDREMLSKLKSDAKYSDKNISTRSKYTECMNKGIIAAGALGGVIGALILNSICKSIGTENDQKDTQGSSPSDKKNIEDNK